MTERSSKSRKGKLSCVLLRPPRADPDSHPRDTSHRPHTELTPPGSLASFILQLRIHQDLLGQSPSHCCDSVPVKTQLKGGEVCLGLKI